MVELLDEIPLTGKYEINVRLHSREETLISLGFTTTNIHEKEKSDGPQLLVEQEQLKKAAELNKGKEALPTNYFLPEFNIPRKGETMPNSLRF